MTRRMNKLAKLHTRQLPSATKENGSFAPHSEKHWIHELLGGGKMVIEDKEDGSLGITFNDKGTGRQCGGCTLCCKLLPIPVLDKKAGDRCKHQHLKGCKIYDHRPGPCVAWTCRWLSDPKTAGMPRPDRCHYVIDVEWDKVLLTPDDGSEPYAVNVLQVWLDPAFPDAWDTPELRAYMVLVAEKFQAATIIRKNSRDAFTVWPPPISKDRKWHLQHGANVTEEQMADKLKEIGESVPPFRAAGAMLKKLREADDNGSD